MIGKQIRMERILDRKSGRTIIVPLDHGVSVGPIYGLTDMKQTIGNVVKGGANAVLIHKGLVERGHRIVDKDGKEHGFKPGIHMVEKSTNEYEEEMPEDVKKWLDKFTEELGK